MHTHIAQVNTVLFDGEAQSATVPAVDGEMTILPHHEPFITTLKEGTITVRPVNGPEQAFEIKKGVLEVSNNKTTILL